MKKLFLSSVITLLLTSNVFALDITPVVTYPDGGRYFQYSEQGKKKFPPLTEYGDIFNRTLEYKNEANLMSGTLSSFGDFTKIVKRNLPNKYPQSYSMISIMPDKRFSVMNLVHKQVSIFVKGKIIGYYLLSPMNIDFPEGDKIYVQIKSLPENSTYLSGKYTLPPNTEIKTYEKEHSGYIERYVTFVTFTSGKKDEFLFAEMFYPKELDGEFDSKIINAIETYSYRIEKVKKYKMGIIPFSEIEYEFLEELGDKEY